LIAVPEKDEPVIVQGITGKYGALHTKLMLQYGTNVAAGVTPGKGGEAVDGVRVYNTMSEAIEKTGSRTSVVFVPAPFFFSAAQEAIQAGIKLLVAITEHVPIRDTLRLIALAEGKGASIIGPNTPGMIVPRRRLRLGIMPVTAFKEGRVALFSRSGTLMYEVANQLSTQGYGLQIAVGVGGDPVNCTTLKQCYDQASASDDVDSIVIVGEIGGDAEETLAKHVEETGGLEKKPVFAYIAGRSAPKEKRMGHAGAIIYGNSGTAHSKIVALGKVGVKVAMTPMQIPIMMKGYRKGQDL